MAAAVFLKKYPEGKTFPLSHGATDIDFAPALSAAADGSDIFFLDCEIGYERFLTGSHKLTIIDHHVGKFDELTKASENSLGKLTYIFNNEKSGSSLAWEYFFPETETPMLIRYIEDADLWRLQYGDMTIGARTYTSLYWNQPREMMKLLDVPLDQIHEKGSTLFDFVNATKEHMLVHMNPLPFRVGDSEVPAYNVTVFQSLVGSQFSKNLSGVVVLYTIEGNVVRLSIRSCEGQSPTALDIATKLGGGGHVHIAGAEIPTATFLGMLRLPE